MGSYSVSYQPLSLLGFETGLIESFDDTLIPEDGFSRLNNAYVWRKRLIKKGGSKLVGRLGRRQDDIAGAGGNLNYTPVEPGSLRYVEGGNTHTDTPTSTTAGTIAGGTITYATGAYAGLPFPGTMSYNVVVDDYSPVMGLFEREVTAINEEELIAFDRKMAYFYTGTDFLHLRTYLGATNSVEWTGEDADFFNCSNYRNAFWATNHVPGLNGYAITNITNAASAVITIGAHGFAVNDIVHISGVTGMTQINGQSGTITATAAATITVNINSAAYGGYGGGGLAQALTHTVANRGDGIRWYAGNGWVNFAPQLSSAPATPYLQGCKFVLPYKDRLLAFNTWEGTTYAARQQYPNRVRWCASLSTPYYASVFPTGESASPGVWYQEPGAGGYLDAPTDEHIIGVQYLKDYVLVLFEEASYLLVYTGNRNLPFVFQKINTDFGSESSNSLISFDDQILSVGNRGIYSVTTSGAERIDQKVPDLAFEMQNSEDGVKRVYGKRNFFPEVVYWAYRSIDSYTKDKFPNKILMYNYINNTWAIFNHSTTCLGTHITEQDIIWDEIEEIWDDYDVLWDDSRAQSNNPSTLGGNQQGFVLNLDFVGENCLDGNARSLVIDGLTTGAVPSVFTVINHNLQPGNFIFLSRLTGTAEILAINNLVFRVSIPDYTADTFTLQDENDNLVSFTAGEEYWGVGKITVLDNFEIVTKSFNPFLESGMKSRFGMVDILANTDDECQILVESYVDKNVVSDLTATHSEIVNITFDIPLKKWYRTFPQTIGQFIQIRLSHPENFMFNITNQYPQGRTGLDITGMQIWFSTAGRNIR